EIPAVVVAAGGDILDEVHDGLRRPVAAGEIDHVIVTGGLAEEVPKEKAMPARLDSAGAMTKLELGGGRGKVTVTDDEGGAVRMDVRRAGIVEVQMIQERRAGGDFDARGASGSHVELEVRIGDARFGRSNAPIDRHVTPVGPRDRSREQDGHIGG